MLKFRFHGMRKEVLCGLCNVRKDFRDKRYNVDKNKDSKDLVGKKKIC